MGARNSNAKRPSRSSPLAAPLHTRYRTLSGLRRELPWVPAQRLRSTRSLTRRRSAESSHVGWLWFETSLHML